MAYIQTTALKKILALKKRLRIVQGGSSAGKTLAILLILIDIAQSTKGKLISVVSESFPHLRRGAIRDFLNIMQEQNYYKDEFWSRTDFIYTFETGSKIEFFSTDQPGKVRGPRRNILFINEANNINYETYTQLVIRTDEVIFVDYNPVASFFIHEEIIPKLEHDFLILTYKDNEALPETVVKELESRQSNKGFWDVYGLGQLGTSEGRIYTDWKTIDEVPHEARLVRYGLDFGYTNDPTASVGIYQWNNAFIVDEVIYQKGLSNRQIADVFLTMPRALIIADSAEPKSIDEIKGYGLSVLPSMKGAGSVNQGIQYVQNQRIFITKRSVNALKEYRNYLWLIDKNGKVVNEPSPIWNHAMDSVRYSLESLKATAPRPPQTDFGGVKGYLPGMLA